MEKKALGEIQQFKNILINAYQKGEFSPNLTPKDLIKDLSIQLQQFIKYKK
jgi:hypothetical protein